MKQHSQTIGSAAPYLFSLYTYNSENALGTITYPSGRVISYGFDTSGRVNMVGGATTYAQNLLYWGNGAIQSMTQGALAVTSTIDARSKERDAETGLDYFGARYYGGALGRFTTPDWSAAPEAVPYADLSSPQTLNLYGYVRNNPLSSDDPDGHCCFDLFVNSMTSISKDVPIGLAKSAVNDFIRMDNGFRQDQINMPDNTMTCCQSFSPLRRRKLSSCERRRALGWPWSVGGPEKARRRC